MSPEGYPALWVGKIAIVSLPAEVDTTNATQVRRDLAAVLARGATLLVVDMTATTFCDSAGVTALVHAYKQASARGAGIRLAVCTPAVQRVLNLTGVGELITMHANVSACLADQQANPQEPPVPSTPDG